MQTSFIQHNLPLSFTNVISYFKIEDNKLSEISSRFSKSIEDALMTNSEEADLKPLKMLPTFIERGSAGDEEGSYFSIDIGGTHFRFFKIDFCGNKSSIQEQKYEIPHFVKSSSAKDLFHYIASSIKQSMKDLNIPNVEIGCMGLSFSFPCHLLSLHSAILVQWTKDFSSPDVVGKDVVRLLIDACYAVGLSIKLFAIINDTTGTYLSGSLDDIDTCISVVNGTGTNACYVEKVSNIKKITDGEFGEYMLLNSEWGGFGDDGTLADIVTDIDLDVDHNSPNPGKQTFEKMTAGMFLGEIVRRILLRLVSKNQIFGCQVPDTIDEKNSFTSCMISKAYDKTFFINKFSEIFKYQLSDIEYEKIFYVCEIVSERAAMLTAACLASILARIIRSRRVIVVDGAIFKNHPTFRKSVKRYLKKLVPENNFKIIVAQHGSGVGAALAARISIQADTATQ